MEGADNYKLVNQFMDDKFVGNYDQSWMTRMIVIDKIEGLNNHQFSMVIRQSYCTIKNLEGDKVFAEGSKEKSVDRAIIYFIEWYNEN